MNLLKRLFGGGGNKGDPNAFIYYVRGHKCGAVTRVRINRSNDLSRDDNDTLWVRKVIVDSVCYGQVEIELRFDEAYRETSRSITGGEFVTNAEWQAQQRAGNEGKDASAQP